MRQAHDWRADPLRLAVEAAGLALWSWNADHDLFSMDRRSFDLWRLRWNASVTFEELYVGR